MENATISLWSSEKYQVHFVGLLNYLAKWISQRKMMVKYFPLDTYKWLSSECGRKLQTTVKLCRVVIFSNHVANIAKDNEWLEKFGARELKISIVNVLNKYTFLRTPDFFTEPLYTQIF